MWPAMLRMSWRSAARVGAFAGDQQIVGAEEHLLWLQLAQLSKQFLPILHVGVVRLVRAQEPLDRLERADGARCVHGDFDREKFLGGEECTAGQAERGQKMCEWVHGQVPITLGSHRPRVLCGCDNQV